MVRNFVHLPTIHPDDSEYESANSRYYFLTQQYLYCLRPFVRLVSIGWVIMTLLTAVPKRRVEASVFFLAEPLAVMIVQFHIFDGWPWVGQSYFHSIFRRADVHTPFTRSLGFRLSSLVNHRLLRLCCYVSVIFLDPVQGSVFPTRIYKTDRIFGKVNSWLIMTRDWRHCVTSAGLMLRTAWYLYGNKTYLLQMCVYVDVHIHSHKHLEESKF